MSTERDRMQTKRTSQNPAQSHELHDPLLARIAATFEADAQTVERVKVRARNVRDRSAARALRTRDFKAHVLPGWILPGWVLRSALATALTLLVAAGAWRLTLVDTLQNTPTVLPVMSEQPQTTIVISNESGFVTVQTGGSQWIVLPGEKS